MASYRRLKGPGGRPGKWQAAVSLPIKLPSGKPKRAYKSHSLKEVVRDWAIKLEAAIAAGAWSGNPRGHEVTLREWRQTWAKGVPADGATARKNASHWRNHIEPKWGGYPLNAIGRDELKEWVRELAERQCRTCHRSPGLTAGRKLVAHKRPDGKPCSGSGQPAGLGAWTIKGAVAHLSGLLSAAVEGSPKLPANPVLNLATPTASPKPIFFWTKDEATRLLLELGGQDALLVDLGMHAGLRIGELLGLRRQYVATEQGLIWVVGVETRDGWKDHPKSSKSNRPVPVPPHIRDPLWSHVALMDPDDYVFTSPEGQPWDDRNFSNRVFLPAVERSGVRRGTCHDMRHTAASWLVQAGVDLYKVQALLGHEKYSTTEKYAHLAPGKFDEVLAAWGPQPLDARAPGAQPATESPVRAAAERGEGAS